MDLRLEKAKVTYYENFIKEELSKRIFESVETIMLEEQIQKVESDEGKFYKLKRKTLVFIDNSIIDDYVLPKIWGADVSVFKFTPEIQLLIELLKSVTPYDFNICLAI